MLGFAPIAGLPLGGQPQAEVVALPTLSLPTYTPGSLTGVGFRPRVTAS